jgi:hypothetical protein
MRGRRTSAEEFVTMADEVVYANPAAQWRTVAVGAS